MIIKYLNSEWATLNPVIQKGELAYDITNNKYKIGNGESKWLDLEYLNSSEFNSKVDKSGSLTQIETRNHYDINNRDHADNHSKIYPLVNSTSSFSFTKSDEETNILTVDSINNKIITNNIVSSYGSFGTIDNNTSFESDGTLVFNGNATVYDDVYPSSVTVGAVVNAPNFTSYNGNLRAYEFVGSGALTKELNIGFQIPHSYKEGTDIFPHIHLFVPNDLTGGTIKFYCEYTWTNINQIGVINTTTVNGYIIRSINNGINNNIKLNFGSISGLNKTISSIFMCRIYRNPADIEDTFESSVWLKSADIHIERDTIGSRQPLIK